MSHVEQFSDAEWVESSDDLQGTAVFDATGDRAAMPSWDELVRQHADRVYRLAYRLSGNQHDAEDLTQETFIRVFRSVQNYQPGTFEGWLHRITTNLFLDMVRRRGRIRMEALPEDYDRVPADEPNPEQIYHDSQLGADLQAALDSLPPEFRAAVVLCDIEGLSYEEIGATLGVKLGTVRSRIHRDARRCGSISPRTRVATGSTTSRRIGLTRGGRTPSSHVIYVPVALHSMSAREKLVHIGRVGGEEQVMVDPDDVFRRAFSWLPSQFASLSEAPVGAPAQFGSTEHLSIEAVAAYVDGELRMKPHLRAAHHLSLCQQCASEVEGQPRPGRRCADSGRSRIPTGLLGLLSQIPHRLRRRAGPPQRRSGGGIEPGTATSQ